MGPRQEDDHDAERGQERAKTEDIEPAAMDGRAAADKPDGGKAGGERTNVGEQVIGCGEVIHLLLRKTMGLLQKARQPDAEEMPGAVDADDDSEHDPEAAVPKDLAQKGCMAWSVLVVTTGWAKSLGLTSKYQRTTQEIPRLPMTMKGTRQERVSVCKYKTRRGVRMAPMAAPALQDTIAQRTLLGRQDALRGPQGARPMPGLRKAQEKPAH